MNTPWSNWLLTYTVYRAIFTPCNVQPSMCSFEKFCPVLKSPRYCMFKEKKIETLKFDPSKICPLIKRREYFPEHTVVSQKLPCPLLWTDYTEKKMHILVKVIAFLSPQSKCLSLLIWKICSPEAMFTKYS